MLDLILVDLGLECNSGLSEGFFNPGDVCQRLLSILLDLAIFLQEQVLRVHPSLSRWDIHQESFYRVVSGFSILQLWHVLVLFQQ